MSTRVLGRLPGAALGCAAAACGLPLLLGLYLSFGSGSAGPVGVFAVFVFAVVLLAISIATGWIVIATAAVILFGVAALEITADLGSVQRPLLAIVSGVVLFVSFALVELSLTVRRSPTVEPMIWRASALTIGSVAGSAAALTGVAYVLATVRTWPAIVLPAAVLVMGLGLKLSVDRLLR